MEAKKSRVISKYVPMTYITWIIVSLIFKGFHWSKIQNIDKKVNQRESWLFDKIEHTDFNFGIKYGLFIAVTMEM